MADALLERAGEMLRRKRCKENFADIVAKQRQTIVSQFYQMDRLVVEGGKSVR